MVKPSLIAEEELRAPPFGKVMDDDRTADGAAVRMPVQCVVGRGEVRLGVEESIAQELKCVAMELACAGLDDDVDHRSCALPEFSIVVAGLNAELLQRVREWKRRIGVGHFIHVVAAVQKVILLGGERSVGTGDYSNGKCLSTSLVGSVALVAGVGDTGNQCDERGCISAVQGQIDDASLVDDLRQGTRGGVDLRSISGDTDGDRGRADHELDIDGSRLVGFERDTGLRVLFKAGSNHRYRVVRGQERGKYI